MICALGKIGQKQSAGRGGVASSPAHPSDLRERQRVSAVEPTDARTVKLTIRISRDEFGREEVPVDAFELFVSALLLPFQLERRRVCIAPRSIVLEYRVADRRTRHDLDPRTLDPVSGLLAPMRPVLGPVGQRRRKGLPDVAA